MEHTQIDSRLLNVLYEPQAQLIWSPWSQMADVDLVLHVFAIWTYHRIYSSDQMKEDKVGCTHGTHGWKEKCVQDFGWVGGGGGLTLRHKHRWESNIQMDGGSWTVFLWLKMRVVFQGGQWVGKLSCTCKDVIFTNWMVSLECGVHWWKRYREGSLEYVKTLKN